MTTLLSAQITVFAKRLSFVSPSIHHLVDSGFCSCVKSWHRHSKTVTLSQRALKSFKFANYKFILIGKRFVAAKKDIGEKEVCYNSTIVYIS